MQRYLCIPMVALAALLFSSASATNMDAQLYEDYLMENLYNKLSMLDDAYYPGMNELPRQGELPVMPVREQPQELPYSEGISLDSRGDGEAIIRDSEYVEHSSNAGSKGFIHMSGGAGEGKQHLTPEGTQNNRLEVKSDEALPFYCHPPNPCPKGYNPSSDECIDSKVFKDTAESQKMWISAMMKQGLCTCDQEHMFECPKEGPQDSMNDLGMAKGVESREDFDAMFNPFWDEDAQQAENPFKVGDKRISLVAKKSPRIKRDLREDGSMEGVMERELEKIKRMQANNKMNPFLQGNRLRTAAKKGCSREDGCQGRR